MSYTGCFDGTRTRHPRKRHMPQRPTTTPLLVRVDPSTRQSLKDIAAASDRTMSQLVRYATVWWTSAPERATPITAVGSEGMDEFINVRFAADEMDLVRAVATETGLERGAVVRCAVRAWLSAGDFSALGDPRRLNDTPPDVSAVAV
jgi:hypothetical protein